MNVPELFSRNWTMKLLSLIVALFIWFFISGGY